MKSQRSIHDLLENFEQDRDSLIPILQEVQEKLGYISADSVNAISRYLDISINDVYGVATFYTQFRFTQPGHHILKICLGTACHVRGGQRIMDVVGRQLGIKPGETTPDYKFSLERVACFGSCALSPVVVVDGKVYGRMNPQKALKLIKELK
ncbi:MAG: NADH-quinone oxidoreductase subunit NuoE [Deltaproteobacteria bacterium]|nr:NADH-quinone oxidoreductase subunit NuoE [Deltaproteobacteria bacterium]